MTFELPVFDCRDLSSINDGLDEFGVCGVTGLFTEAEANEWRKEMVYLYCKAVYGPEWKRYADIKTADGIVPGFLSVTREDIPYEDRIPSHNQFLLQQVLINTPPQHEMRKRMLDFMKLLTPHNGPFTVSMDGAVVQPVGDPSGHKKKFKIHTDGGPVSESESEIRPKGCIQAQFVLNKSYYVFHAMPGSHKHLEEIFTLCGVPKEWSGEWYNLSKHLDKINEFMQSKGYPGLVPIIPKDLGTVILWRSRTIHCAGEVDESREDQSPLDVMQSMRVVCFATANPATKKEHASWVKRVRTKCGPFNRGTYHRGQALFPAKFNARYGPPKPCNPHLQKILETPNKMYEYFDCPDYEELIKLSTN